MARSPPYFGLRDYGQDGQIGLEPTPDAYVAKLVEEVVPGSRVTFADTAGPDKRNYRVNCDHVAETIPEFQPVWTVRKGVEELYDAYQRFGLTDETLHSWRLQRIG